MRYERLRLRQHDSAGRQYGALFCLLPAPLSGDVARPAGAGAQRRAVPAPAASQTGVQRAHARLFDPHRRRRRGGRGLLGRELRPRQAVVPRPAAPGRRGDFRLAGVPDPPCLRAARRRLRDGLAGGIRGQGAFTGATATARKRCAASARAFPMRRSTSSIPTPCRTRRWRRWRSVRGWSRAMRADRGFFPKRERKEVDFFAAKVYNPCAFAAFAAGKNAGGERPQVA